MLASAFGGPVRRDLSRRSASGPSVVIRLRNTGPAAATPARLTGAGVAPVQRLEVQVARSIRRLATDLASAATTPNVVFITPNLISDMHDGTINQGDTWLSQNVPAILNSPAFTTQNSVLDIVWDEDDSSQSNQVPSIIINSAVTPGYHSFTAYTHYSWLKTIESAWSLAPLTTNDGNAAAMSDFFTPQTGQAMPGAPTGVTATAGRRSAKVSWTPPGSDGGCAITSYRAAASPGGASATTAGTSVKVSGLTPGTTYTLTVTATNCVGTGPASAPSNPVVPTKH
jgi:fibronectin type III domain protein/phosphoesterase family protein